MAKPIDLNDYVEVRERIATFYREFPAGAIRTELVLLHDDLVVFKALVFRDQEDPHPTTGWAYERAASNPVGHERFVENCETSAIGRALANRNFAGARRPSREEMAKVQRMRRQAVGQASQPPAGDGTSAPDRIRRLLSQVPLARARRKRIEAKLAAGLTEQEAHDLEAYLLALRPRTP